VPMLQQGQIVHKKSGGARKGVTAAAVVLVLAALGFVVYTTGWYKQVTKLFGKGGQEEAANAAPAPAPASQAAAPAPAPVPIVWTTNLSEAAIPSAAASGKINEITFKVDSAKIDNGILVLRHGTNQVPDLEVGVQSVARAGENVAGKKLNVSPEPRAGKPRVWKRWVVAGKPQPQAKTYGNGYAMKLELGEVNGDQVSGKIYLALPDETESVIAGTFVATIGQTAVSQAATPTAAPTGGQQMSEEMRRRYGLGQGRSPQTPTSPRTR